MDFYSTFDWFENLAANCLQEAEKAEVLACDGVVMPLRTRSIRLGPLSGIASRGLSNFYSCCFAPLGISSAEGAFPATASLGRHLRNRGIATLWFDALDETPKETLAAGLKHSGWLVEPFPQFGNWYIATENLDFETYWRSRPGALRNTGLRRHRALIERGDGRILCFADRDDTEAAVDAYESVYARSWQPNEPFPGYIPGLIRRGLAAQEVQVWCLFVKEIPVAAQIWVRRHGNATIFKLAYDQDWGKQSAGTILTMAAIRTALTDKSLKEIDFGWGDDAYKQEWLPNRRQRYGISAYNPRSVVGLGLAARNIFPCIIRIKSLIKR